MDLLRAEKTRELSLSLPLPYLRSNNIKINNDIRSMLIQMAIAYLMVTGQATGHDMFFY